MPLTLDSQNARIRSERQAGEAGLQHSLKRHSGLVALSGTGFDEKSRIKECAEDMECENLKELPETALEHARYPRNQGPLERFNGHARITGPCGDTMEFWLLVRDGTVERASYVTDGCGSSQACGSMVTCLVQNHPFQVASQIRQEDILTALGGLPPATQHCALLAANTLRAACEDYLHHLGSESRPCCGEKEGCDERAKLQESSGAAPVGLQEERKLEAERRRRRLARIRHKIVVLSGKGGVGKSTVAVNLAQALHRAGHRVGLLDIDIHGPSVPTMLGLETKKVSAVGEELLPVDLAGLKVMSIGFMLSNQDLAVIWRGPMKMSLIKQFLQDVDWGELDFLIIDSPPGTGDEPLSVCQLIGNLDGAVVVTTPQKVAAIDVRKSITFCHRLGVPVLGVIENMSGFVCPRCGELTQILRGGAGRRMGQELEVPFLGSIPIDPTIADSCDDGQPFLDRFADSHTAGLMREVLMRVEERFVRTAVPTHAAPLL
jgi:ATP-binding protein involved in chromosome partitioning